MITCVDLVSCFETRVILKSEQLVTLASSLAQDIATLHSRSNGMKTSCAVPPPQPLANVEAHNDEDNTDIHPSTDQFMEHSTGSPMTHSPMEKDTTTVVDASPLLGPHSATPSNYGADFDSLEEVGLMLKKAMEANLLFLPLSEDING